jgi:hypothetical protein
MSLFCLLWLPLVYLLWRAVSPAGSDSGGVWALLLGSIVALVQFFLGSLISPGGFGFSRWLAIFVEIISVPAVLPFIVCVLFRLLRVFSGLTDLTQFALLWLIPGAAIRAISWSALKTPSLLVLAPVLWSAIAVGIPGLLRIILNGRPRIIIPMALVILALPFLAATAHWAFFSQRQILGILMLTLSCLPMLVSLVISYYTAYKSE